MRIKDRGSCFLWGVLLSPRRRLLFDLLLFRFSHDLLFSTAHHLPAAQGIGMAAFDAHEREAKEAQAFHWAAVEGRKEPVQTERLFPCFGDHDLVTSQQVDVILAHQVIGQ